MNTQKLIVTTFVILLTAIIVVIFKENSLDTAQKDLDRQFLLDEKTGINDLQKISFEDGQGSVTLEKNEDNLWAVAELDSFPADAVKIYDFVEKLKTLGVSPFAKKGDGLFDELGLADPSDKASRARRLTLTGASGTVLDVLLGDSHQGASASSGNGVYFRMFDSSDIYLLQDSVADSAVPKDWARLKLFSYDRKDIASVEIRAATGYVLTKDASGDAFNIDGQKTNASNVDKIMNSFKPFEVGNLVDGKDVSDDMLGKISLANLKLGSGLGTLQMFFYESEEVVEGKQKSDYLVKINVKATNDPNLSSLKEYFNQKYFSFAKWRYGNLFVERDEILQP